MLNNKITNNDHGLPNESTPQMNLQKDSLQYEINKRENLINELKAQISILKNINSKDTIQKHTITDTLPSEEKKKLLYSIKELQQHYENKLKICDNEKRELQSKLNIMKRGIEKYGGNY